VYRPLFALLLFATLARAQSAASAALEGSVADPAGHHLPDATVTLRNTATGEQHSAPTDPSGAFRFSLLPPATYQLDLTLPGFQTARLAALTLNASELPLLDATLTPGDPASTAPCNCRLRAAAPSTGTLVDQKTITSVPLNTRNFTQVLSLSSGSVASPNNAGTLGRGTPSVNVNGNTSAGGYTVDGAWAPSTVPNPDAISEFKIQTSQNDAMFGAMVPNTNLMTRRGENTVHGNLWEFLRNDAFNANAFFRNATGQPKPNLKQNQYGATAGGPIRRNQLFYFGSFQGTRQVNGLDPTSTSNLILPALTSDRSAAALAAAFCPANHPGDSRFTSYAGGRQLNCANQSTSTTAPLNPIALRLLQMRDAAGNYLIPNPQTLVTSGANAGLGFSSYSMPSTYNENHFVANADYFRSPAHTLAARVFTSTVDQLRTFGSPGGYPGAPIVPGFGAPQALAANDIAVSAHLTSQLSPRFTSEAVVAYTRNISDTHGVGTPDAASTGITPVDPLLPQPPEITILGPLGSFRLFGSGPNDNHFQTRSWSFSDNLATTRGRHRIRTGAAFVNQYNGRADTGGARGKLTFQTFEDFLLGLSAAENLSPTGRSNIQSVQASEGTGPHGEVEYHYRRYYAGAFLQDDIKLAPRFTLNLGLRWEYIGPSFDETGAIGNLSLEALRQTPIPPASGTLAGNTLAANYDPTLINPYTHQPFGAPPAGVTLRASKSFYENGAPRANFAPRAGFAWQPTAESRLVLGGAYGWFFQNPTFSANAGGAPLFTSAPFAQGFTNSDSSNNLSTFAKPFPTTTLGYVPRTPTSQLSDRIAGPAFRIPRLQQWNLTGKLRLMAKLTLDLGYVGSRGSRLLLSRGLNQPLLSTTIPNTAANAPQRVPILGETQSALLTSEYTGDSWYHSVQATLRKQLSRGITFQAAYTFSKSENNLTVLNDQNNLGPAKARASFDRTHRLIANFDYNLGRGFSVTGIVLLQTGLPLTLTDPNGGTVYGRAATSTVTLCPNSTYNDLANPGAITDRLNRWINPAALCNPAPIGADGSAAYGTAGQSIINGPHQVNADLSFAKRTKVGGLRESAELLFRVELYNALNHPQFSNPGATYRTASFGVITTTATAPRLIQFGLKYLF
jgi:hypothetical protein